MDPQYIPFITTQQMVEVDRLMVEEYGIKLIQMMENAGRQLARLGHKRFLEGDAASKNVVILAGSGGNGGGALACARNLHNWGGEIEVVMSKSAGSYSGVIRQQIKILQSLAVSFQTTDNLDQIKTPDLVIDGIIGYSLRGAPTGHAAEMIRWVNRQDCSVLALDVPSGVDSSTGEVYHPAIQATATLTLALPKYGLKIAGTDYVGELYLADIGVPPELFARPSLNLKVGPIFHQEEILHLTDPAGR